jgi:hypothetical protein
MATKNKRQSQGGETQKAVAVGDKKQRFGEQEVGTLCFMAIVSQFGREVGVEDASHVRGARCWTVSTARSVRCGM